MTNESSSGASKLGPNQWAMLLHLSQLSGFVVGVVASVIRLPGALTQLLSMAGLVAPIAIWQLKKAEIPSLDAHGKMVANWIINVFVVMIAAMILMFVPIVNAIVAILMMLVGLAALVCIIIGTLKAKEGIVWNYPIAVKVIK